MGDSMMGNIPDQPEGSCAYRLQFHIPRTKISANNSPARGQKGPCQPASDLEGGAENVELREVRHFEKRRSPNES